MARAPVRQLELARRLGICSLTAKRRLGMLIERGLIDVNASRYAITSGGRAALGDAAPKPWLRSEAISAAAASDVQRRMQYPNEMSAAERTRLSSLNASKARANAKARDGNMRIEVDGEFDHGGIGLRQSTCTLPYGRDTGQRRRTRVTTMPTPALQARLDATMSRADEVLRARLKREQAELERDAADQRRADAQQAREDVERRRMIVSKFDDAFAAFSTETPQARDDEAPGDYRRRLFERLRRRLPDSHDLANIRANELPSGQAYLNFERMIIDAAKAEGERPSFDNLPPSGELISRTRTDEDSGAKATHWYGRESFIKELGRPAHKVVRVCDPRTQNILWGAPFSRAG